MCNRIDTPPNLADCIREAALEIDAVAFDKGDRLREEEFVDLIMRRHSKISWQLCRDVVAELIVHDQLRTLTTRYPLRVQTDALSTKAHGRSRPSPS